MDVDSLRIQYEDNVGRAERLREAVVTQLMALFSAQDVTLGVPMESRVKVWASVEEKLERKQLNLPSLFDLQDLIGVRAILLFRSDLDRVVKLVKDTFARLGESEFGYQSQHFVVRLPQAWLSLPSLANLTDLCVELQVRTLAQHIWAAASHKLQYKHESGVPPPLRRTINRVAALLETVDLEFDRVLAERRTYLAESQTAQAATEPLNVDSLSAVLSEVLPAENRKDDEPYAVLLADLTALNVHTPEQLRQILIKHAEAMKSADVKRVAELRGGGVPSSEPGIADRVARGVFFAHVGLTRQALRAEFGKAQADSVMRANRPTTRKRKKSGG